MEIPATTTEYYTCQQNFWHLCLDFAHIYSIYCYHIPSPSDCRKIQNWNVDHRCSNWKSTSSEDAIQNHTVLFSKHPECAKRWWKMLASETLENACADYGRASAAPAVQQRSPRRVTQYGVGGGGQICWLLRDRHPPSSSNTSVAVPPNAEAHLVRLVTQLIKSSWALRWDAARGMLRPRTGPE